MKVLCRYVAIAILSLIAIIWIALQTDRVQLWAKDFVVSQLEEATGYHVLVGQIGGTPPLFTSLENIEFFEKGEDEHGLPYQKKLLSIGSLEFMPAWFDLFLGKLSFLYVHADDIDLTNLANMQPESSQKALLPSIPLCVYTFSLSHIRLPSAFSAPLLNDFHDDLDLNIHYNAHGKIHWRPKKGALDTTLTISPSSGGTTLGSLTVGLDLKSDETKIKLELEAVKAPSGSVFITLPVDQLSLSCDLAAKSSTFPFNGQWRMSSIKRANETLFSPFTRFTTDGSLTIDGIDSFAFMTNAISCAELTPDIHMDNGPSGNMNRGFQVQTKTITGLSQGSCRFSNQQLTLTLESEHLRFEDIELASLRSWFTAGKTQKGWHGAFDIATSIRSHEWLPVKSSGQLDTDGHIDLDLQNFKLSVCDYPIEGNLHIALYPLCLQGKLVNSSPDAALLAKQLGFAPQGNLDLAVDFGKSVKIAIDGSDFQHGDFSKIKFGCHSDISLDRQLPFSLYVQAENKNRTCSLKSDGTIGLSQLSIDTLIADIENSTFKNEKPIQLHFSPTSFTLEEMEIHAERGGSISAQWNQTEQAVQASLTADNLLLETFNPFLHKTTLSGSVSGHLQLTGPTASPKLSATFASSEWFFDSEELSRPLPLMTSGRISIIDGIFDGDLELQGIGVRRPIVCSSSFPLHFSLVPLSVSVPENGALTASLKGEVEIGNILASLGKETTRIEGLACADVTASGTLSEPRFFGQVLWNQGMIRIPYIGSEIANLQMGAKLENEKLIIEHFSATDGKKGAITGTGEARLSHDQTFSYQLASDFTDFEIISLDETQVRANAHATLEGNLQGATLQGNADVVEATLFISPNLSAPLPDFDITYINREEATPVTPPEMFHFNLDLDISMPGNGTIRGMGLQSEWKGQMHLTGRDKQFQLNGEASAIKGTLEFGHRQFALSQATMEFHGDPLTKSQLNVIASQHVSHIATQILLRGSLESPRLDFQSTPPMSQKEIISWILFNKSSTEISPFEGVQLAQVLLKIQNNSQSPDLFEQLKQMIGIDRIGVGPASSVSPQQVDPLSNEVSVHVGKYLSDGVIVTLSKDVTNEVNRVGIEANITKNIIAEANVGDDSETQVSLQWKYNY